MADKCTFCDRTQFEKRIIAEDPNFYVVATVGQIVEGYILVIPKRHVSCMGEYGPTYEESNLLRKAVLAIWQEYGKKISDESWLTVFEHGIVGQTINHAHMHILPGNMNMTPRIRADFPSAEIEKVNSKSFIERYQKTREPYLMWSAPGGQGMICWNPPAPPQYLRTVAAELLGHPERANWREMDPMLDAVLTKETVTRLKPYFA